MDGFLRTLALFGVIVLPAAWFVSLSGDAEVLRANAVRTLCAIAGGGVAWLRLGQERRARSWTACLAGGVAGSLVVSLLSIPLPALGGFAIAGWLTSGIVGGGVVALASYAALGPAIGRPSR